VLLEVQGSSLEHLLSGLLARELIRQPLAERYGLGPQQIALLRQSPFRLLLRPRAQGAFQASIELQVAVGANVAQWKDVLSRLAKSLEKEGLRPKAYEPQQPLALWQRSDGVVVGGWQWLSGEQAINLFLGPQPPEMVRFQPRVGNPKPAGMVLLARPRELAERGLLPPDLPEVVKRSSWLWVNADPFPGFSQPGPLSQLQGSLTLRP
jgi:hypothetical protein